MANNDFPQRLSKHFVFALLCLYVARTEAAPAPQGVSGVLNPVLGGVQTGVLDPLLGELSPALGGLGPVVGGLGPVVGGLGPVVGGVVDPLLGGLLKDSGNGGSSDSTTKAPTLNILEIRLPNPVRAITGRGDEYLLDVDLLRLVVGDIL